MEDDTQSTRGLKESQHSLPPHPPRSTPLPPPEEGQEARKHHSQPMTKAKANTGLEEIRGLLDGLIALVLQDRKAVGLGLAREINNRLQHLGGQGNQEAVTIANLQRVVVEAVQAATKATTGTPPTRTWADIATGLQGTTFRPGASQSPPRKAVPKRASREVLIRSNNLPADLAKRTPAEITQAVNQATGQPEAIAARKLPSGDTVVTFRDQAARERHSQNTQWIQQAFGDQAKEACKTFAVLVKGLRKSALQGVTEEEFGKGTGLRTIDKVKFRLPSKQGLTWATALVTLTSQEEAYQACEQGLVWNAQILDCEPYWAVLEPKQCYKCWKWGHIQRYCSKPALCSRCGTKAHGEGGKAGEAQCPTHSGQIPCRCPNCGGSHTAWAKECPGRVKAREEAREAYQYRPRAFEAPKTTANPQEKTFTFTGPLQAGEDDGFQQVSRKRPRVLARGRPTGLSIAGQDPSQTRITLGPPSLPTSLPATAPVATPQLNQAGQASQAQPTEAQSQEDTSMDLNEN